MQKSSNLRLIFKKKKRGQKLPKFWLFSVKVIIQYIIVYPLPLVMAFLNIDVRVSFLRHQNCDSQLKS